MKLVLFQQALEGSDGRVYPGILSDEGIKDIQVERTILGGDTVFQA